ncbi:hypothetical protein U1Q18_013132 [Sarracenia purpurea var. burkii]
MADGEAHAPPSPSSALEQQFEDFRHHLNESGSLRERIRCVATEIESATRVMHSSLLLVHQSRPVPACVCEKKANVLFGYWEKKGCSNILEGCPYPMVIRPNDYEILEKAEAQIGMLKELFHRLAEILLECPGQYYRYHGDWRSETQSVVSVLAFMHWLETGSLLMHTEAEKKLGLDDSEFGLDIEDYLIGICFMSNELPRYVVNQVTAGDYDCPRKVLKFLTDLHAAFRMLNLRNDFLRKKFDGMKYDLRKVEEVHYDVKIRGLAANGHSMGDQRIQRET